MPLLVAKHTEKHAGDFLFLLDSLSSINNLSVKQGRVYLGWTSTKLGYVCLAQWPQRSDAVEARTRGPPVSSQALYHWATALPRRRVFSRRGPRDVFTWDKDHYSLDWLVFHVLPVK